MTKKHYFYNELARFYDDFYQNKKYKEEAELILRIIKEKFPVNKAQSLLDIGCGTSLHLVFFAKYIKSLYGIDPSEPMIDIAKNKKIKSCSFSLSTIQDFHSSKTFDIVTSFNSVLNYLRSEKELRLAFERIFFLLASKGVVIVQLHDCKDKNQLFCREAKNGNERLLVVGDWVGKNSFGPHNIDFFYHLYTNGTWKTYHDVHKEYLFSKEQILSAMKNAGFTDPYIIELKKGESPFFSAEFLCVAEKC